MINFYKSIGYNDRRTIPYGKFQAKNIQRRYFLLFHQNFAEFFHAFGGAFLDLLDATAYVDGVGVDEVDGGVWTSIVHEACSWIKHQ